MQVVSVMTPALSLPDWVDSFFAVVLIIGFPVALLMAWAFEMTPQGVKRTEAVVDGDSITDRTGRKLDITIVIGLGLVVLLLGWQGLNQNGQTSKTNITGDATSIAVLPFVDLSPNGDQEFFADGISEEILNVLVPIEGLKVAGRTSSFSFKGRNQDLREIGAALNVNHVLEGSVRRSGTKLRITAQLIRSDDGFHIWSETYDRELTDIFEIQDEIARSVADQLATSLGLSFGLTSETLVKDRTEDIVAYDLYLKAKKLYEKRGLENLDIALLLLIEATTRDPDYAPSFIVLSNVYSVYQAYQTDIPSEATIRHWRSIGKAAARRAIKLSPDSGAAYASLGSMYTYDFDWIKAFENFDKALVLAPDNANIRDRMAQNLMEVGQYKKAIEMSLSAIDIDPLVAIYHRNLANSYGLNGDIEKAIGQYRHTYMLEPSQASALWNLWNLYISEGRTKDALNLAEEAFASGHFNQGALDYTKTLHTVFESGDDKAIHASIENMDNFGPRYFLAHNIGDKQIAINAMDWYWENAVEQGLYYTTLRQLKINYIYDQPRFKEQVRKDNILAYWQHAGFPPQCRAAGEDDFTCD
jgi:TolB-like protein/Tfp pilus assembly protein PilF